MPKNASLHNGQSNSKTYAESNHLFLNVSKKILARESIFRNIDCNISHQFKKATQFLTEQQIKLSSIYQRLFSRTQKTKRRQEQQKLAFHKNILDLSRQIQTMKDQIQEGKVDMWQLKNEVLELEDILTEEIEQYEELYNQLQQGEQDGEDQTEENESDQIYSHDYHREQGQDQDDSQYRLKSSRSGQQQEAYSKPSCSIKYFISNRTITETNLSKQTLSVGQAINVFPESENQDYTQIYIKPQSAETQSHQNMVSFKKTDNNIYVDS